MHSVEDVLAILSQAQERRRVSETMMNKSSSRSHCLFSIYVRSVDAAAGPGADGMVLDRTGKGRLGSPPP